MRVFTVHLRRHGLIPEQDFVLVREGFSWAAFLFTFVWALWHRMWWTAVWIFIAVMGAGWAANVFFDGGSGGLALSLAVSVGVGFVADELRRRHLAGQGFADAGVVAAADLDAARHRFLDTHPDLARDMVSAGLAAAPNTGGAFS